MPTTYCPQCGAANNYDLNKKPESCSKCKTSFASKTIPATAKVQLQEKGKINFVVQPISDEELALNESTAINLGDVLLHPELLDRVIDNRNPRRDIETSEE
jgi:hypothetical protein